MIDKIKIFLTNRYNWCTFYVLFILFIILPFLRVYSKWMELLRCIIYIPWGLFFIAKDIKQKKNYSLPYLFLFIYICIIFLSLILNFEMLTLTQVRMAIGTSISYYLFVTLTESGDSRKTIDEMTILGRIIVFFILSLNTISLILLIFERMQIIPDIGFYEEARLGSLKFHGIYAATPTLGGVCVCSIILTLFLLSKKKINKIISIFNLFLCVVLTYLSFHRTSIIQIFLIAFFIIGNSIKKVYGNNVMKAYYLMTVISVLLVIVFYFVRYSGSYIDLDSLSSGRWAIWNAALKVFTQKPLFGWGYCNGSVLIGKHNNFHNFFINSLVWTGVFGTCAMMAFIYCCFFTIKRKYHLLKDNCWIVMMFVCLFIRAQLETTIFADDTSIGAPLFWIASGFVLYHFDKTSNTDNSVVCNK